MAPQKPIVARTFAPVHFEDLDPHRFEDLVRELIYDFRDWRSIEATGRSGGDDGFDIRAREKASIAVEGAEEDDATLSHPMDGNLWMIQGKREKEIGPAQVKKILADVDPTDPPYGYILAASAVFSKASYDVFREVLRTKGVMEFYLWGKPELEDMLHLPKNDRILFTFFGISLTSRRRSRATEVRSSVVVKNKLFKALGSAGEEFRTTILLRDINDTEYPYSQNVPDFDKNPRWGEYDAFRHHPRAFFVHKRKFFAYVDREKKEWDFTKHADNLFKQVWSDEDRAKNSRAIQEVQQVWDFLPRSQQAYLRVDAAVKYEDVVVVDAEGDSWFRFPHIYVEYSRDGGPFARHFGELEVGHARIDPEDEGWTRIEYFPKTFSTKKSKWKPLKQQLEMNPPTLKAFSDYSPEGETLYAFDDTYGYLKERDLIRVAGLPEPDERFVQITWKGRLPFGAYLAHHSDAWKVRRHLKTQFGRDVQDDEEITVIELKRVYKHQYEAD